MRRLAAFLGLVVLTSGLASAGAPPVRAAQRYALATEARYEVRPEAGRIEVTVDARFTNRTPNPPGQFSVFTEVPIAVHDAAASVEARDARGRLHVDVARRAGGSGDRVNVATVELRRPLRFDRTARFTLTYTLRDGTQDDLRVRPSVVVFPVWSFGTQSEVRVELPSSYEVSADGDPLRAERDGDQTALTSGPIGDPERWLAVVTANRASAMTSLSRTVPLDGGTVDLNVRAWNDDQAWGRRTLALLQDALPALEDAIGLPYTGVGPLVVSEAVPSVASPLSEAGGTGRELQVAFDQPPFTAIHQAAHMWFGTELVGERWIREGLASYFAASVARSLDVDRPYAPVAEADRQRDHAFALESWMADSAGRDAAYGYPASWAVVDRVAARAGAGALREVLQRTERDIGAYDAVDQAPSPATATPTPLDSRTLLDQLEAVSGRDLTGLFRAAVFGDASDALLEQRAEARDAYGRLVDAAGDWGAPAPVRRDMAAWNFEAAGPQLDAAMAWIRDRDTLLAAIDGAGLSTPERLRNAYEIAGGGSDARVELQAERAVVDDYRDVLGRAAAGRSFVQRVGLLGAPAPDALLAEAHRRFADGDLRGAADATAQARLSLESASTSGTLRLVSAAVIVLIGLAAAIYLLRRRRTLTANVD